VWDAIATGASAESSLWEEALRPEREQERTPVFSSLASAEHAIGLETIYEGYLAHYGTPRLFAPVDRDSDLLLGDYLYAHGLVRIAESGDVEAVADLAELISLCAQSRAARRDGDGAAWAATASSLGGGRLELARAALRERGDSSRLDAIARAAAGDDAVDAALAAHARFVG
jgi:hypothetical protein